MDNFISVLIYLFVFRLYANWMAMHSVSFLLSGSVKVLYALWKHSRVAVLYLAKWGTKNIEKERENKWEKYSIEMAIWQWEGVHVRNEIYSSCHAMRHGT